MRFLPRLLCLLRGHVQGGPLVISYQPKKEPEVSWWPAQTTIKILGIRCPRCGAIQGPADQPEAFAAAREMVKSLTGTEV